MLQGGAGAAERRRTRMTLIVFRTRLIGTALLCAAALARADAPPAPAVAAPAATVTTCPAGSLSSQPYFQSGTLDLVDLVPPPPPPGSAAAARDLEAVLDAQRVAHQLGTTARAVADAEVNCLRFADVLGPNFSAARAPRAVYFLNRAAIAGSSASGPGKTYWWRLRPYMMSPRVERLADVAPEAVEGPGPLDDFRGACNPGQPPRAARTTAELDPQRGITSYPSGHAAFGMSCAILLAEMVPEQRDALFVRGREYGLARLVVGAHFATDVEAGRVVAAVAAAQMQQNAAFRHDFELARIELRAALGLPREPPDLTPKKPEPRP
jgi:acid phosphatase (class A)